MGERGHKRKVTSILLLRDWSCLTVQKYLKVHLWKSDKHLTPEKKENRLVCRIISGLSTVIVTMSCHLSGLILATDALAVGAAVAPGEGAAATKRVAATVAEGAAATAESGTGAGARAATGTGRRSGTEEETETETRTRLKTRQRKRGK